MPAYSLQRPESLTLRPASTATFAVNHRRFCQVLIAVFWPLDMLKEVKKLTMATMWTDYRSSSLIWLLITVSNSAFILYCRRTSSYREPCQAKCRRSLLCQSNRIPFASNRVFIHLIRQEYADWSACEVIGTTSTSESQKAAGKRFIKDGFFWAFLFCIADDFTKHRRNSDQRANTFFWELLCSFFFRLQKQNWTWIKVCKIPKKVFQQRSLH